MPATPTLGETGRRRRISLNRRLTLTYVLITVPFLVASGWFMYQRQVAAVGRSAELLASDTGHAADQAHEALIRAEQTLRVLSALTAALSPADCNDRLPGLLSAVADLRVERVRIADKDGTITCAVPATEAGGSVASSAAFQRSRASGEFAVAVRAATAEPLTLSLPIRRAGSNAFMGAVLGTLPVAQLYTPPLNWAGPTPAGLWLLDAAGRAEALPGGETAPVPSVPSAAESPAAAGKVQLIEQGSTLLALAPVLPGVALLARFPDSDLHPAILGRFALPVVILCGLLLTGLAVLLIGLTRWVVEPLQALDRMILSGSMDASADPALSDLPDHIYHLGQSFASRHAEWSRDLRLRDLMLEEVHHRIKNSFQMVLSLLRMQERSITDPAASSILRSAQERVSTLFVVHRLLERSADGEVADAGELVWNVADTLVTGGDSAGRIAFDVEADPLPLRADQAVVLGLVVNEWLTNSLRHGFPGDRKGRIEVRLSLRDDVVTLYYGDDGVGRSERSRSGFGTRLISGLVQQLEGDLQTLPGPGSRWELRFRMPKAKAVQPTDAPASNDQ